MYVLHILHGVKMKAKPPLFVIFNLRLSNRMSMLHYKLINAFPRGFNTNNLQNLVNKLVPHNINIQSLLNKVTESSQYKHTKLTE